MSEIEDETISTVIDIDICDKTLIVSGRHDGDDDDNDDDDGFRLLFLRLND